MTREGDAAVPRIERLLASRAGDAGALLAASHEEYPAFRHLFPDPGARRRVLQPFMAATARDAARSGHALAAIEPDGRIVGVALWMPPGTFPLPAGRKARVALPMLRVMLAARRAFPAFARTGAALQRELPQERAWYLQAMGVHPGGQRRGIGGRLLAPGLALADEAGVACALHTSDAANVEYYRRFGFEVTRPHAPVFPGGPSYLAMARPAASAATSTSSRSSA